MGERVVMFAQRGGERPERAERPERPEQPERPERPEAAEQPAPATGADAERPVAGKVIINGREISVENDESGEDAGSEFPRDFPRDIPPGVQNVAEISIISFALMIAAFPVFGFLKAIVNRRPVAAALPPRDTTDRLQRIEAAVEAMAVEVERISEGQRFVTKVLAERSSASQP